MNKSLLVLAFLLIITHSKIFGEIELFQINNSTIQMIYCPGGSFDAGVYNNNELNGDGVINGPGEGKTQHVAPFWIAETELTFEVWETVYQWAIKNDYEFANPGKSGASRERYWELPKNHPVSSINWRDALVFCNALTEFYNYNNPNIEQLSCVYFSDEEFHEPLKKSNDKSFMEHIWDKTLDQALKLGSIDNPYVDEDANGFRLLHSLEWECAARYIDGETWNHGSHVSGDLSGPCILKDNIRACDHTVISVSFNNYSIYNQQTTAPVKSLANGQNSLGCYDMSGNVNEWCFDLWYPGLFKQANEYDFRIMRGGSFQFPHGLQYFRIGFAYYQHPNSAYKSIGMRLGRNF